MTTKDGSVKGADKSVYSGLTVKKANEENAKSGGDAGPPHPHFDTSGSQSTYPASANNSFIADADNKLEKAVFGGGSTGKATVDGEGYAIKSGGDAAPPHAGFYPAANDSSMAAVADDELAKVAKLSFKPTIEDAMSGGDDSNPCLRFELDNLNPITTGRSAGASSDKLNKAVFNDVALRLKATADEGCVMAGGDAKPHPPHLHLKHNSTNIYPILSSANPMLKEETKGIAKPGDFELDDTGSLGLDFDLEDSVVKVDGSIKKPNPIESTKVYRHGDGLRTTKGFRIVPKQEAEEKANSGGDSASLVPGIAVKLSNGISIKDAKVDDVEFVDLFEDEAKENVKAANELDNTGDVGFGFRFDEGAYLKLKDETKRIVESVFAYTNAGAMVGVSGILCGHSLRNK